MGSENPWAARVCAIPQPPSPANRLANIRYYVNVSIAINEFIQATAGVDRDLLFALRDEELAELKESYPQKEAAPRGSGFVLPAAPQPAPQGSGGGSGGRDQPPPPQHHLPPPPPPPPPAAAAAAVPWQQWQVAANAHWLGRVLNPTGLFGNVGSQLSITPKVPPGVTRAEYIAFVLAALRGNSRVQEIGGGKFVPTEERARELDAAGRRLAPRQLLRGAGGGLTGAGGLQSPPPRTTAHRAAREEAEEEEAAAAARSGDGGGADGEEVARSACNVFVSNLPDGATRRDVLQLLGRFGHVAFLQLRPTRTGVGAHPPLPNFPLCPLILIPIPHLRRLPGAGRVRFTQFRGGGGGGLAAVRPAVGPNPGAH